MNVCIPVDHFDALDSRAAARFGCANTYLILDTEARKTRPLSQLDSVRSCKQTFELVKGEVDEVWCGQLRHGAAMIVDAASVTLRQTNGQTVRELLEIWETVGLPGVSEAMMCDGTHCRQQPHTQTQHTCCGGCQRNDKA